MDARFENARYKTDDEIAKCIYGGLGWGYERVNNKLEFKRY